MNLHEDFKITKNSIIHKVTQSSFIFYGIARNISEMKSLEGVDILYIEEGESLTKEQLEILAPTIRKEGSEIYIVFNPKHITDFVYDHFITNTRANCKIKFLNYTNNPHISQTLLDEANMTKLADYDDYKHIWLGEPLTDDDKSFIKYSWVLSAIDSHLKLGLDLPTKSSDKIRGFDVADDGGDLNVIITRQAYLANDMESWKGGEDELMRSTRRAIDGCDILAYDSIGVGASVGSMCNAIGFRNHKKFNAGAKVRHPTRIYTGKVKNKEMFSNFKAQSWQRVADKFLNTYRAINGLNYDHDNIISICSKLTNLNKLVRELCTPFKDEDLMRRRKVESKKDLMSRGVKSPNYADSFIITFADVGETKYQDVSSKLPV